MDKKISINKFKVIIKINDFFHKKKLMIKKINYKKVLINLYIIFFSCLLTFLYIGPENLSIYNFNWLFYGDASSDLINWLNFKNSSWNFPVGLFEIGEIGKNSIVYTGAVPIFSIIFKIFFKNFNNFHYFAFWIFFCFYLQYLFSYLILKNFYREDLPSLLGSFFFVLSPIFLNRLGIHLSLGAHWILLMYFFYKIKIFDDKKFFITIICISLLIHFYFTMMIILVDILYVIFFKKIYIKKNLIYFLKFYFYIISVTLVLMYIFGYFSIPLQDTIGYGYGIYKLNLLSIFNPSGNTENSIFNWSLFLPSLNLNYGEEEGFNYLGLGYIFLLTLFVYYNYFKNFKKIHKGYYYIILLLTIFSLSNNIDFEQFKVLQIPLNKFIEGIFSTARASGRFFWPVYYFLLFCCLISLKNIFKANYNKILIIFLLIQFLDLVPGYKQYIFGNALNSKIAKIDNVTWSKIIDNKKIFTSTYQKNQSSDFYKILPLSVKENFQSEINYFARYDREKLINSRYENYNRIFENNLEIQKVYVINNMGHLNHIKNILNQNTSHKLIEIDDIFIMVDNDLRKNLDIKNINLEKIKSKEIIEDYLYKPKFEEGSNDLSFLGIGWTKHGIDLSATSDGDFSTLIFNFSKLKKNHYKLLIDIDAIIITPNQNIYIEVNDEYGFRKEFILNKKKKNTQITIPIDLNLIQNNENYMVDFFTKGQITDFEVLKSPDKKKIGFKINSIKLLSD